MYTIAVQEEIENKIISDDPVYLEKLDKALERIKMIFSKIAESDDPDLTTGNRRYSNVSYAIDDEFGPLTRRLVYKLLSKWHYYTYKGYIFSIMIDGAIKLSTWNEAVKAYKEYPNTFTVIDLEKYLTIDYLKQRSDIYSEVLDALKTAECKHKELNKTYEIDMSDIYIDSDDIHAIYNLNQLKDN